MRLGFRNTLGLLLTPAVLAAAGCGGRVSASNLSDTGALTVHADSTRIDTNSVAKYVATLPSGEEAKVAWSVSGGDPHAGAGAISADGVYTPPSYLTQEAATVSVRAVRAGEAGEAANSAILTVTPGFLQPLTPGNLALAPGASATISGSISEVGGSGGIRFRLASDTAGTPSNAGTLGAPHCTRGSVESGNPMYTVCTVTYTAPPVAPASGSVLVLGSVAANRPTSWTRILLNNSGVTSNPVVHQARLASPVLLGSSTSNNSDYDTNGQGQIADCCGGTLGSLLQDSSGTQYVLSNNHVLARSDQSLPGETIVQPGLIDNGCTPYGVGPGTSPVATLIAYPALSAAATNVDAAIARVSPGAVDARGTILELGGRQADGTLAAAPPGISSSGGRGEAPALGMLVAKSGRTTGLTCAAVSAVNVDVVVDYFTDCAETAHAFSKTFTNQIAVSGANFSDAGDSGALVVDTANAEPVGLFFAGGTDTSGVEQAIANPVKDVLDALVSASGSALGAASPAYSFVGGADHPVSCLSYGTPKPQEAAAGLDAAERARVQAALPLAQFLLNVPGVARIGVTASKDHPDQGAIAVYTDLPAATPSGTPMIGLALPPASLPASIDGVATVVLPASSPPGSTPADFPLPASPRAASLAQVLAAKQRNAATLLKSNPALFGVGVGQSLDNPWDAALILFLDRKKFSGTVPAAIDGQRVRAVLMDRFHVTRSHGTPVRASGGCSAQTKGETGAETGREANSALGGPRPGGDLLKSSIKLPD